MAGGTHINVTVDFTKRGKGRYDLRIPVRQPMRQLLGSLDETLELNAGSPLLFAVKIPAKELLLSDGDCLGDYPVTNGDLLVVL